MTALDLLTLAIKASRSGVVEGLNVSIITKACRYFHYCCDGFDDKVSMDIHKCVSMVIAYSIYMVHGYVNIHK